MTLTFSRTDYTTNSPNSPVVLADVNTDGKLDVVQSGGAASSEISVFLGNGDGTFQPYIASPMTVGLFALGDMNGDGMLDIAGTYYGDDAGPVYLSLGNGDGTFQTQSVVATEFDHPYDTAIADVNGDGSLDLVVANTGQTGASNTVSVLLGNGDGTFQQRADYLTGNSPFAVAAADLNGDGELDLATANADSDSVSVLLGNGDGTFQAQTTYPTGSYPFAITVGDLDGNGTPDLAATNYMANSVSVLKGNGDGTFQGQVSYSTGDAGPPIAIQNGDLDGDGNADLVIANGSTGIAILLGNGDGTFQPQSAYGAEGADVAISDLNGDGRRDLVTNAGGGISVFLNTTTPNNDPVITTNGGGSTAAVSVAENTTAVTTVVATDADAGQTLTYAIADGADGALFTINATTGALNFTTAPNFENPTDDGANNVYDVAVQVSDGNGGIDTQAISVAVQNVPGVTINGTGGNDAIDATHTVAGQPLPTNEEDTIKAGGGKDTINALGGNDFIDGGAGADTMAGGPGNDIYVIDDKGDVVLENSGNGTDTVQSAISFTLGANFEWLMLTGSSKIDGTGNAVGNNITGNSGNNILYGLAGDDLLNGAAGNDYLVGGLGADILTGGLGADVFVFNALADSTPAAFDIVQDYVHGMDKIDVVGIDANTSRNGNQTFAYAGQNSGVVANSVTWYESGGNTFVQADVNGNTTADVLIELAGTNLNLISSDFLL